MLQAVEENVNREQHYPVKSRKDRNNLALENRELNLYGARGCTDLCSPYTWTLGYF